MGYDKVGLHGLSGTPESYIKNTLKEWNPKPLPDCFNMMLLHQNFKEFLPSPEEEWLDFSDLPKGFDLFLLGHFHTNHEKKHPKYNTPILVPGSTIATQLNKIESEKQKGFYILEIGRQKADVNFMPIPTRPIFYEKLNVNGKRPVEISAEISTIIRKHLETKPRDKPLIRIKLEGILAEGFSPADLNFGNVMDEFSANAIISLDKTSLRSVGLEEQSKLLQELKEKRISLDQIGLKLLRESIKEKISLKKLENIFSYLINDSFEQAESEILAEDVYFREELKPVLEVKKEIPKPKEIEVKKEEPKPELKIEKPEPKIEPPKPEPKKEIPKAKRELDPKETELAESGMSLLAAAGKKAAAPRIVAPKPKPTTPKPAPREDTAQTAQLASSGLEKLAAAGGPKTPSVKPVRKRRKKEDKDKKFSMDKWLKTGKKE